MIALLCVLPFLHIHAQQEEKVYPLEEVEIVSDRLGLSEARTGRHVSVIRGEEILALPVHSLDEQ